MKSYMTQTERLDYCWLCFKAGTSTSRC